MTGRRLNPAEMPDWPRFMVRELAAAYVGVSPNVFDKEVAAGMWPKARLRGAKGGLLTWDRVLLDAAADRDAGLAAGVLPGPVQPVSDDEIRDRLNRAKAASRGPQARRKDAA
jgi:hypothetical protein